MDQMAAPLGGACRGCRACLINKFLVLMSLVLSVLRQKFLAEDSQVEYRIAIDQEVGMENQRSKMAKPQVHRKHPGQMPPGLRDHEENDGRGQKTCGEEEVGSASQDRLYTSATADVYGVCQRNRAEDGAAGGVTERDRVRYSDDSILHQPRREKSQR